MLWLRGGSLSASLREAIGRRSLRRGLMDMIQGPLLCRGRDRAQGRYSTSLRSLPDAWTQSRQFDENLLAIGHVQEHGGLPDCLQRSRTVYSSRTTVHSN